MVPYPSANSAGPAGDLTGSPLANRRASSRGLEERPVITGRTVKLSEQAGYDEYLQEAARRWETYYAGERDAATREHEVAEGATRTVGFEEALSALGLASERAPELETLAELGAGRQAESGAQLSRQRGDRVAYIDMVIASPKSISVEIAALKAAGREDEARALVEGWERAAVSAFQIYQRQLPLGRRDGEPAQAQLVALANTHSASRPVAGQSVGDPHLHVHLRILNLARLEDGSHSAVNQLLLFRNVRAFNALAESEYQAWLHERGYETRMVTHGQRREWTSFELAQTSDEVIAANSTRQRRVEELALEEQQRRAGLRLEALNQERRGLGLAALAELPAVEFAACRPSFRDMQALARASRESKLPLSRDEQVAVWREQLAHHQLQEPQALIGPRADPELQAQQLAEWSLGPHGLTAERSVFSREDAFQGIACEGAKAALPASVIEDATRRTLEQAVALPASRADLTGVWTTEAVLSRERLIAGWHIEAAQTPALSVPEAQLERALLEQAARGRALDPEQEVAMRHLAGPARWAGVVGVAGAGKTTTTRPAVRALELAGYQPIGVALSASAAQTLEAETGMQTWNIEDFLTREANGLLRDRDGRPLTLGPRSVLIVDESGTVPPQLFERLVQVYDRRQLAAVRNLGDPLQTQPIGGGQLFGWLERNLQTAYLSINYRQGDPEGVAARASRLAREGRGYEYFQLKDKAGQLRYAETLDASVSQALGDWAQAVEGGADPAQHVIQSDLNRVVDQANAQAHLLMEQMGRLQGPELELRPGLQLRQGERVAFNEAWKRAGRNEDGRWLREAVPKRTRAQIVAIDPSQSTLTVATDANGAVASRRFTLSHEDARAVLGYGYASTTAVGQGRGWEHTYNLRAGSQIAGLEQSHTAVTRAKLSTIEYVSADSHHLDPEEHPDLRRATLDAEARLMARCTQRATTLDYLSEEDRAALDERLIPNYLRVPDLGAPASERQLELLAAREICVAPDANLTLLQASAALDALHGHPPGSGAAQWLAQQHGLEKADAERRVSEAMAAQHVSQDADLLEIVGSAYVPPALAAQLEPAAAAELQELAERGYQPLGGAALSRAELTAALDELDGRAIGRSLAIELIAAGQDPNDAEEMARAALRHYGLEAELGNSRELRAAQLASAGPDERRQIDAGWRHEHPARPQERLQRISAAPAEPEVGVSARLEALRSRLQATASLSAGEIAEYRRLSASAREPSGAPAPTASPRPGSAQDAQLARQAEHRQHGLFDPRERAHREEQQRQQQPERDQPQR